MGELSGARIEIKGIVQGVGFRPFVYGLARDLLLMGWVRNTSAGVEIQVDGPPRSIAAFVQSLGRDFPPLARIDAMQVADCQPQGFSNFEILQSQALPQAFQPISPDVCICPDCLQELFDPGGRRYLYPFTNCTNCGPRYTIIEDIPYDRPNTTMSGFPMCAECSAEYHDPLNRRFHAQPVACHTCGPHVWLEHSGEKRALSTRLDHERSLTDLRETQRLLLAGKVVAVKGLGGFHLACNALNSAAVAELRRRKLRVDKPFALMMPDLQTIEQHCLVTESERALLESRHRPIVVLRRRPSSDISTLVAPDQNTIGVMLPYTPLHYLLFAHLSPGSVGVPLKALVMTSGNLSEEPIATDNDEARQRLETLADAFLMHNRPIRTRCDDSVMRIFPTAVPEKAALSHKDFSPSLYPMRRSRGYTPDAVRLPWDMPPLLAAGSELKNTFCLAKGPYAFISHHIGDLENYETLCAFEDGVSHFQRLFRIEPGLIAYDLHPNYLSTRYALQRAAKEGLPTCGVQHHHAHIAACMAEQGLEPGRQVIGVAFDGTGYGTDGCIWGGEILVCSYDSFYRSYHLRYTPLAGGDQAVREPWRMALSWLSTARIPWEDHLPPLLFTESYGSSSNQRLQALRHQLQSGLNAPQTSSIGRLFDAVASLIGVKQVVNYEAQAAVELEALADEGEIGAYAFAITKPSQPIQAAGAQAGLLDPEPLFSAIISEMEQGVSKATISARFHNALANAVRDICVSLREETGIADVALSGGVWQNIRLLGKVHTLLRQDGFNVLIHRQVPANDGGISLGQAVVAAYRSIE